MRHRSIPLGPLQLSPAVRVMAAAFSIWLFGCSLVGFLLAAGSDGPVVLNDDGAWCWFQDQRALVHGGKLIVGSVANGRFQPDRKGDIEVVVWDPATGVVQRVELHDRLQADDHNAPALLARPDGRILAVYAKHGPENRFYYRITQSPADPTAWGESQAFVPTERSRITYSNLHFLTDENGGRGRVYNFYRGLDASFKPSYAYSDDLGETWKSGNVAIDVPAAFKHRPYVKYANDGRTSIHLLYTEGHPRDYDNSLYHAFYCSGRLFGTSGDELARLEQGLSRPEQGTRVFQGGPDRVAWCSDLELDADGRPFAVYSVQVGSQGLPPGQGGTDHRFRYGRWDGQRWQDHEVAYAGTRLYAREDDYTGLICLDPDDLATVFLSTDADPVTGKPLISSADSQRHREIFRGRTDDGGRSWSWAAVTSNSRMDNLRPIVPRDGNGQTLLLWYRGRYRSYTDYDSEIVAQQMGS